MSQLFVDAFRRLSSRKFIEETGFAAMDIGARGGLDTALLPLAWATEMTGFEPDREAAAALDRSKSTHWKRSHTIPSAVAGHTSMRALYVPKSPESASLLRHNPEMIEWFGMDEQHGIGRTFSVETDTLDELQVHGLIGPIDYLKIDVEGAEGEILGAAEHFLARCLAIRVEVSFLEQRIGQPLIWEIGSLLQQSGFATLDIIDVKRWRHGYVAPHPYRVHADLVYSKGVVAQADLVCVRDFRTRTNPVAIAKLGLIAAAMGYIGHGLHRPCATHLPAPFVIACRSRPGIRHRFRCRSCRAVDADGKADAARIDAQERARLDSADSFGHWETTRPCLTGIRFVADE